MFTVHVCFRHWSFLLFVIFNFFITILIEHIDYLFSSFDLTLDDFRAQFGPCLVTIAIEQAGLLYLIQDNIVPVTLNHLYGIVTQLGPSLSL